MFGVKKNVSGTTTHFHYNLQGRLIAETAGDGTPFRDYIYQNGNLVALKLYGTQAGVYYVISDHLGTPQQIVDSAGTVVWKAAFLPFGKAQVLTETVSNNIRFPGQYFDAETGLHYNWNRYYDPDTGRYLTPDPIGLDGGLNLYAYVAGDPVNGLDPTGLFLGSGIAKVAGKIAGKTAQESAIVGKAADSAIGVGIEAAGGIDLPNAIGYTSDGLQAIGGAQSIGLGSGIAAYSSVPSAVPLVLAGLGGAELGFAFNNFYKRYRGQSLGGDIYDWLHTTDPCD
ncbi:RHS repeat-associated core domain-containing protein [Candidatus Electrothrix marina]|uniref:RHS repeat-associated core domain-containing protein n=1 Tax=Candidatus Electrothrix marina TaxID=1859130 RepID=A0A444JG02_9BACT|nr:RHS repeat-associated core domain-containing protein [Candidatus Electrothrix marina]